jgi:hypothetical protein
LIDENWIKMRLGITEHYPLIDEKRIKNRLGIENSHSEVVVEVWIATSILYLKLEGVDAYLPRNRT